MTRAQEQTTFTQPPLKRYRVGEVAAHTGLTRQTIHNYTHWGLIREAGWSAGGHRLYDESVFERLARVLELKATRSIAEIRELMPPTTQQ